MSRRLLLGLAPFAIAAAGLASWQLSQPQPAAQASFIDVQASAAAAPLVPADVYGFPITIDHSNSRMNVALVTAPFPDQMWASAELREAIGVGSDGHFPVRVWRVRHSDPRAIHQRPALTLITTVRMPAAATQLRQFSVGTDFREGDLLAVEYNPGLLDADGWPIASLIDNVSGDPVSMPAMRTRILVPIDDATRRRAVRP